MCIVIYKYKSLVSAVWLLLLLEYVGRFWLGRVSEIKTRRDPPGKWANRVVPWICCVMFYLSFP